MRADNLLALRKKRYVLTTDSHHPFAMYPKSGAPSGGELNQSAVRAGIPANAPAHRLDEFPANYSSAGLR
jgi:hypothetical protein